MEFTGQPDGNVVALVVIGVLLVLLPGISKLALGSLSAETRGQIGPRVRQVLVTMGIGSLALGLGLLVYAAARSSFADWKSQVDLTPPPPVAPQPTPRKSDLLPKLGIGTIFDCPDAKGSVTRFGEPPPMVPTEGLDLDCNKVTPTEEVPGADISGQRNGGALNLLSKHARAAKVYDLAAPDDFQRCAELDPAEWTDTLEGLGALGPDDGVCVRTSEGNLAIVMFDPAFTTAEMKLRYWIQYRR